MNKKQLSVTWIAAILIVITLGSRTGVTYKVSDLLEYGESKIGYTSLFLYGTLILSAGDAGNLYPLLYLGEYKYQVIVGVLLIAGLAIYTLRDVRQGGEEKAR